MSSLLKLIRNNNFVSCSARSYCKLKFKTNEKVEFENERNVMYAWEVNSYGDTDKLMLNENVTKPIIRRPTEVLIKVTAASLNPIDVALINGYGREVLSTLREMDSYIRNSQYSTSLPLIVGRDFSGVVIAKGNDVKSDIAVGDRVYGVVPPQQQGSLAENVVTDDYLIAQIPNFLTDDQVCGIPYAAMTAWSALQITGDLFLTGCSKKRILIIGGSGGVGIVAIQLLKAWDAFVVTTCKNDAIPMVETLNPDIIIDYTSRDWLNDLKYSGKFDIILDASGVVNPSTYIPFLKDWSNSKFITLKSPMLKNADDFGLIAGMIRNVADFITSNLYSGAVQKGSTIRWGFFLPIPAAFKEISNLVKNQQLKPVIEKIYPFEDMENAFKRIKEGHLRGKVVVKLTKSNEKLNKDI